MTERWVPEPGARARDWAGHWRTLAALWGVPVAAMLAAMALDAAPRAAVWSAALAWMGVACLANARRCSRTHCRFTGPFFLLMAVPVIAYAVGVLPLGGHGWLLLGGTTVTGAAALWWGSERILGAFSRPGRKTDKSCR